MKQGFLIALPVQAGGQTVYAEEVPAQYVTYRCNILIAGEDNVFIVERTSDGVYKLSGDPGLPMYLSLLPELTEGINKFRSKSNMSI